MAWRVTGPSGEAIAITLLKGHHVPISQLLNNDVYAYSSDAAALSERLLFAVVSSGCRDS